MSFLAIILYIVAIVFCLASGLGFGNRWINGWNGMAVFIFAFAILGHIHVG